MNKLKGDYALYDMIKILFYLQKIELAVIEVHTRSKNQDSCFFLLFFHSNKEQY